MEAAALAVDALEPPLLEALEEPGAVLDAAALAGADFAADVFAAVVFAGVVFAGAVFAADVLGARVVAEPLLVVFEEVAPELEAEVRVAPFVGAAAALWADVPLLAAAEGDEAVSVSAAGLSGLVADSAAVLLPVAEREEPALPRRSAAARAIAPAMS